MFFLAAFDSQALAIYSIQRPRTWTMNRRHSIAEGNQWILHKGAICRTVFRTILAGNEFPVSQRESARQITKFELHVLHHYFWHGSPELQNSSSVWILTVSPNNEVELCENLFFVCLIWFEQIFHAVVRDRKKWHHLFLWEFKMLFRGRRKCFIGLYQIV